MSVLSRNFLLVALFVVLSIIGIGNAQSTTTSTPPASSAVVAPSSTTSEVPPTIVPSTAVYTYIGCYNETTGNAAAGNVRALEGNVTSTDSMTVEYCLQYCGSNTYAGIEYGRECYCAPYLNVDSNKVPDSNCSIPCAGNPSEVCGGSLRLSLYQHKNGTSGADLTMGVPYWWSIAAGFGFLGVLLA